MGGSRCSSLASTRNSRDRCTERASDSLLPAATDVDAPQAVLAEIPAVIDSDWEVPCERPASWLPDAVPGRGRKPLSSADLLLPVPVDTESLTEADVAREVLSPTVLV